MNQTLSNEANQSRIFTLCCLALTVTSMTFAIRAGILGQLGTEFGLSNTELGWVVGMAFWGFPVATMLGGALYNTLGARNLIIIAFAMHLLGLLLTIFATGFWGLLISTFLVGFANGSVEAGCNPLIADSYPKEKTRMLNRFHVWFPGGILIGALLSNFMTNVGLGWQLQVGVIILPTLVYGALLFKCAFPKFELHSSTTLSNFKSLLTPLFIVLALTMTVTATTELAIEQWIKKILGSSGASPMIILALISGLMAVGRFYAGPIINKLNPIGVLLSSSVLATIGIFMMSQVTGNLLYVAAIFFALGVCYFWPTMLGCVAEYTPQTGALGISLIGGVGMATVGMWNPVIGGWLDAARASIKDPSLSPQQVDVLVGQEVLMKLLAFPLVLIVVFAIMFWVMKRPDGQLAAATQSADK